MKDPVLLDRLIHHLIDSGLELLFQQKDVSLPLKALQHQKNSENNEIKGIDFIQAGESKRSQLDTCEKDDWRCSFDRWNSYFEEILVEQVEFLERLTDAKNKQPESEEESYCSENFQAILSELYSNLEKIKQKLNSVSNVYSRFLAFVCIS